MILAVPHHHDAEPWKIDPDLVGDAEETSEGVSREAAFWNAADQLAADAGSDELEDPFDWTRTRYRLDVFDAMCRALREPGDAYRAEDGTLYVLAEDPAEVGV